MSNLGFQSAVAAFAAAPGVHCERAFWEGKAPRSFETGSPLTDFDLIAFSVSFEREFLGIAASLAACGIPVRARDRSDDDPLVVMGGVCAFLNPEPVADFMDAVLVGDAEALVPAVVESLAATAGAPRAERLAALARGPGVYVPALYGVLRMEAGVAGFRPAPGAPFPVRPALEPGALAQSTVLSSGAFFRDMFLIETGRGCGRGCRFCAAGHMYVPRRTRHGDDVIDAIRAAAAHTRRIGLVAAALGDHPQSREMLRCAADLGCELNVSSLGADVIDDEVAALLVRAGVRTATLAPETGTEELRAIAGKPMRNETFIDAAGTLAGAGMERLKLYFMVGLPGEREEDVRAIPALVRSVHAAFAKGRRGGTVSAGVSVFVPKPRTPFQWLPMVSERDAREKLAYLRGALSERPRVGFSCEGPRESRMEGLLARGGREVARAIELAAIDSVPWKAALKRGGVDADSIIGRNHGDDDVFPWEIVDVGVPRPLLLASLRRARELILRRPGG
jgi:radical SAM superfamily enzyme YgiQ (UPF0313 family)